MSRCKVLISQNLSWVVPTGNDHPVANSNEIIIAEYPEGEYSKDDDKHISVEREMSFQRCIDRSIALLEGSVFDNVGVEVYHKIIVFHSYFADLVFNFNTGRIELESNNDLVDMYSYEFPSAYYTIIKAVARIDIDKVAFIKMYYQE